MIIEIKNLTEAQAIAIEDFFANWVMLGNVGSSRWTAFYADGDGNFRPKIKIDGKDPKNQQIVSPTLFNRKIEFGDKEYTNRFDSDYAIDFDVIAWALHKKDN